MEDTTKTSQPTETITPVPTVTAPDPAPAPAPVPPVQEPEAQQIGEPESDGKVADAQPAQVTSVEAAPTAEPTVVALSEPSQPAPTPTSTTTADQVAQIEPVAEAKASTPAPEESLKVTQAPSLVPEATPLPTPETVAAKSPESTTVASVSPEVHLEQVAAPLEPSPTMTTMTEVKPAAVSVDLPVATTPAVPATDVTPVPEVATETPEAKEAKKVDFTEVEEPQNPLTERFTSAEWKALKEFRPSLPKILAQAYPEDPKASSKSIKLWGIEINPQEIEAPKDARVSVILMKFLRARNLNPSAAEDMMVATLRWRDQFNVDAAMKETFPEEIFGQLGHVYGKDKEGRPVVYNLYGANKDLKAVFGDVQRFLRWRVKLMEESIAHLDFINIDQTVQIHDYEGVSLSSRDANSKQAASEASSIFQAHYPELLHRKFFVNVPSLLNWIFWLFKPLISANTLAKMSVVGSGSYTIGKTLLPVINKDQLPKRYGGEAEAF
ncbi:hypothetical protein ONZ45_g12922 [Pleurotus djamor]|nr:hypothetical protein ONZ45_g12922 [Pleurotus djamor]